MVAGLVADVVSYLIDTMAANCKCTVTTLPFEKLLGFDFMGNQMGRTALHFN